MTAESLELFAERIRRMVENLGESFESPSEDWISMLFFEKSDSATTIAALPPDLFMSNTTKDMLVSMLEHILRAEEATRYALLLNGWTLRIDPLDGEPPEQTHERMLSLHAEWAGHFHEHPERMELLTLHVADHKQAQVWMAEIKRTDDEPPTLTEWQLADGEPEGRFAVLSNVLREEEGG